MISIHGLQFSYPKSEFQLLVEALEIGQGEKVAVVGPSGSGKTTFLNLLSGIHAPEQGKLIVAGKELSTLNDGQRRDFRINQIGMVFQQFELVQYLAAFENILLPYFVNRTLELTANAKQKAEDLAKQMGLGDKLKRFPSQLSQGEQQRVAICRALITDPKMILADEPTGNLDPKNKSKILDILFRESETNDQTLVVVTHDMNILEGFDRTIDFETFRSEVGGGQ